MVGQLFRRLINPQYHIEDYRILGLPTSSQGQSLGTGRCNSTKKMEFSKKGKTYHILETLNKHFQKNAY